MSIAAMNWVWQLKLKPSKKFVLLALADAADDDGYCWPSVPTISDKTCLDNRSVQRILQKLKAENLVRVEARYRNDGSRTSNGFCLPLHTPSDILSPPSRLQSRGRVTRVSPGGGADATLTTTLPITESKLPQPDSISVSGDNLIFPSQMLPKEIALAINSLDSIPLTQRQELLDELAARLNANSVRGSPLSYLRSLIARAAAGTFAPEAGVRVALARERDKKLALQKQSAAPPIMPQSDIDPREHIKKMREVLSPHKIKQLQEE